MTCSLRERGICGPSVRGSRLTGYPLRMLRCRRYDGCLSSAAKDDVSFSCAMCPAVDEFKQGSEEDKDDYYGLANLIECVGGGLPPSSYAVIVRPRVRRQFCKRGHEFTEANTRYQRDGNKRACKACDLMRAKGQLSALSGEQK